MFKFFGIYRPSQESKKDGERAAFDGTAMVFLLTAWSKKENYAYILPAWKIFTRFDHGHSPSFSKVALNEIERLPTNNDTVRYDFHQDYCMRYAAKRNPY